MKHLFKLVRVQPDFSRLEKQLDRIATALELYMGIIPAAPEAVEDRTNPVATYSTEADLIREEWARLHGLLPAEEREP